MQTPAEKCLVCEVIGIFNGLPGKSRVLNIGAGKSVSIESQLYQAGIDMLIDRVDVDDCSVSYPGVENCWKCSVENMYSVASGAYTVAYANYVLEHVANMFSAAREVYRILAPGGWFVISTSNPAAPEFLIARFSPFWFHRWTRKTKTWETNYAYKSISMLTSIFETAGFWTEKVNYYPITYDYFAKYFPLNYVAHLYDWFISKMDLKSMMGNVCCVFQKPG